MPTKHTAVVQAVFISQYTDDELHRSLPAVRTNPTASDADKCFENLSDDFESQLSKYFMAKLPEPFSNLLAEEDDAQKAVISLVLPFLGNSMSQTSTTEEYLRAGAELCGILLYKFKYRPPRGLHDAEIADLLNKLAIFELGRQHSSRFPWLRR